MFECGEVVEICIIYRVKGIVKERQQKVVILKILEDKFQVCDFVLASNKKSFRRVQTNQGVGFASIANIYMVKEERCNCVGLYLINPQRQIDFILRKNEEWKLERAEKRQKRAQAKIVRAQKHIERMKKQKQLKAERKKREQKYISAYSIAMMNNDKEKMKEIESVVGYAPIPGGGKSRSCYRIRTREYKA